MVRYSYRLALGGSPLIRHQDAFETHTLSCTAANEPARVFGAAPVVGVVLDYTDNYIGVSFSPPATVYEPEERNFKSRDAARSWLIETHKKYIQRTMEERAASNKESDVRLHLEASRAFASLVELNLGYPDTPVAGFAPLVTMVSGPASELRINEFRRGYIVMQSANIKAQLTPPLTTMGYWVLEYSPQVSRYPQGTSFHQIKEVDLADMDALVQYVKNAL